MLRATYGDGTLVRSWACDARPHGGEGQGGTATRSRGDYATKQSMRGPKGIRATDEKTDPDGGPSGLSQPVSTT